MGELFFRKRKKDIRQTVGVEEKEESGTYHIS